MNVRIMLAVCGSGIQYAARFHFRFFLRLLATIKRDTY